MRKNTVKSSSQTEKAFFSCIARPSPSPGLEPVRSSGTFSLSLELSFSLVSLVSLVSLELFSLSRDASIDPALSIVLYPPHLGLPFSRSSLSLSLSLSQTLSISKTKSTFPPSPTLRPRIRNQESGIWNLESSIRNRRSGWKRSPFHGTRKVRAANSLLMLVNTRPSTPSLSVLPSLPLSSSIALPGSLLVPPSPPPLVSVPPDDFLLQSKIQT
jgi:hypothetical protein